MENIHPDLHKEDLVRVRNVEIKDGDDLRCSIYFGGIGLGYDLIKLVRNIANEFDPNEILDLFHMKQFI